MINIKPLPGGLLAMEIHMENKALRTSRKKRGMSVALCIFT